VHFLRSGVRQQLDDRTDRVSADDRVVDQDYPFPLNIFGERSEFLGNAQAPQTSVGLNKRSSDVAIFAENFSEWDSTLKK